MHNNLNSCLNKINTFHIITNKFLGVAYISWNPDSTHLLVCGPEESPEVLLWNVENENFLKVSQSPEDALTCCAWNKDGTRFVVSTLQNQLNH